MEKIVFVSDFKAFIVTIVTNRLCDFDHEVAFDTIFIQKIKKDSNLTMRNKSSLK